MSDQTPASRIQHVLDAWDATLTRLAAYLDAYEAAPLRGQPPAPSRIMDARADAAGRRHPLILSDLRTAVRQATANPPPPRADHAPLGARTAQVLELIAQGKQNAQIGVVLYITEDTVKSHVRRLMKVFGCPDRASVVATACRLRVLIPSPDGRTLIVNPTATGPRNDNQCADVGQAPDATGPVPAGAIPTAEQRAGALQAELARVRAQIAEVERERDELLARIGDDRPILTDRGRHHLHTERPNPEGP